jgi:energy-coupling factor transporter ATP-binding protein EcfA2
VHIQFKLTGDQRAYFGGKTGSGKTYLARYLLKLMRAKGWRVVIVDPKKDWQGRGKEHRAYGEDKGTGSGTVDHPVLVEVFQPELAVQIFQPVEWDASCDAFAQAVMTVGNTVIYFDEITQLANATRVPKWFNVLWTQGRAINVAAWCGSQRPRNVPIIVKDQAEAWYIFRIKNLEDRKAIAGYIPTDEVPDIIRKPLPLRYFWYYHDDMDKPVKVAPLNIKKGGSNVSSNRTEHGGRHITRSQA